MHALPMRATTFLLLSLRLSKFLSLTNKNDSMDLKKFIFSLIIYQILKIHIFGENALDILGRQRGRHHEKGSFLPLGDGDICRGRGELKT